MCARCDTRPTARRRTWSSACRCSSDSGPILTTASPLRSGWPTLYQSESGLSSVQVLSRAAEHRQVFTGRALSAFVEQNGWRLVARHDLANEQTGQQDAPSLLLSPTLVGDFVRYVNRTFNPDAHISRFIWVLT